ncbi:MAG: YciI family protein [Bacteroidota bacterium]
MKQLYIASCILFIFACQSSPGEKASAPVSDEIGMESVAGLWVSRSVHVIIDTKDGGMESDTIIAEEADYPTVLGIYGSQGIYNLDSSVTSYYMGPNDSILGEVPGRWYMKGDSMIMTSGNENRAREAYRVQIDGDKATFTGWVDWDTDGKADDLFSGSSQRMTEAMRTYFIVFLYAGENPPSLPETEEKHLQELHLSHIRTMSEAGKLAVAGPFIDDAPMRGMFILAVDSMEEAESLTQQDPKVQSGHLRVEIRPWYGPERLRMKW